MRVAVLVLCAVLPHAVYAQGPPPGVFTEVETATAPRINPALEPSTVRSRMVQVDTRKITAARRGREVLKLNLFDDATVEVDINRVRPTRTGFFISGSPKGTEWGEVRLVVNGPVMVGTVITPEAEYRIRSAGSDRHIIRQIDRLNEIFECETRKSPLAIPSEFPSVSSVDHGPAATFSMPSVDEHDVPTEDGSEIRILVVYTPAMQAANGGVAGMRALIDLFIQSANQAFADSGINPRLVLAHAALVNYLAKDARTDQARLHDPNDGHMDEVHALRDKFAADLVHLLTNAPARSASGVTFRLHSETLSFESDAFAVTAKGSEHTFAHETGHNFGLAHDRYDSRIDGKLYPYAFGYVNKAAFEQGAASSSHWRTIMAVSHRCIAAGLGGCARLLRFSNPNQTFRGDPLGVPGESTTIGPDGPADARRTINNTARWVGSFRSEACTQFTVSPTTPVVSVAGGEVILQVEAAPGCVWSASTSAGFVEITSPERAAGTGLVQMQVQQNHSGMERNGTVTVADQKIVIRQLAADSGICGRTNVVQQEITKLLGASGETECDGILRDQLANVQILDLRNRGIRFLKEGDLRDLTGLRTLRLSGNQLTALPEGIFRGLSNLRRLHIGSNQLIELSENQFQGLSSLEYLNVSFNRLARMSPQQFIGLSNLESLVVSGNQLADLPDGIFKGLSNLESIDLHQNRLSQIAHDLFGGLSNLNNLNLSDQGLKALPAGVFSGLTSLESLSLSVNRFASLPLELFAGLTELQTLNLSFNQLTSLPDGLFQDLLSLQSLDLTQNQLTVLPPGLFAGLSWLEVLRLEANQFTELPEDTFAGLSRLRRVDLGLNALTRLPARVFSGLPALEYLDLRRNNLVHLPADLFSQNPRLKTLILRGNVLYTLPNALFSPVAGLETLNLGGNKFRQLPDGVFSGLKGPNVLDLDHNPVFPLPVVVSLEEVGDGGFRANAPSGAPYDLVLPITISSAGEIEGDTSTVTISSGALESRSLRVERIAGTEAPVRIDFGSLPQPPTGHSGYFVAKDESLPRTVLRSLLPADAKLIDLYLDETRIEPVVAEGIENYEAIFAHETASVTLMPKTSNPDATVTYVDDSGSTLSDADFTTDGFQMRLELGENEITLRVTSANGSTNQEYRLVVIRDGPTRVCVRTPQVKRAILENISSLTDCSEVTSRQLSEIDYLELRNAGISSLDPGDFLGLNALRALHLGKNNLSVLPAGVFTDLGKLEDLQLWNNRLSSLPEDSLSGLDELKELRLNGNELRGLPEGIFSGLSELRYVDVSDNDLRSLSPSVFSALTALETLLLAGNNFSSLPDNIFSGLDALSKLYLSRNFLSSLGANQFEDLSALQSLTLDANRLTGLPSGIFSGLPALELLWLQNNTVDPLPLYISLEKAGENGFKAVADWGAPFDLEVSVATSDSGVIDDSVAELTIPAGASESKLLGVIRVSGTEDPVTVDISSLPGLPSDHLGYRLQKDQTLPREILSGRTLLPPAQVTGVQVKGAFERLDVSWNTVSDASGYKVQWKSGTEDYAEDRQVALLGGETTNYTIIDLTVDTEYTIRVIATRDHADDGEPSDEVTGTPASPDPDVNADGTLDGDDAQVMYQAYASDEKVGDGESGGTAASRRTLLSGLAGTADPSDDDLKAMLRKANVWRSVGVAHGGDINEDGAIDGDDAFVMYYAYEFADLVGDGETGGTARHRQHLLASRAGKDDPSDEDLKKMLRRANKLKEDFG